MTEEDKVCWIYKTLFHVWNH